MYDPVQTLPYDVLALIADQLTLDKYGFTLDIATLRALSQTCKLMVPVCRRHLFSEIWLYSHHEGVDYKTLLDLLREKIETASYVRKLHYAVQALPEEHIYDILEALLGHSFSLQDIDFTSVCEWSSQPESTKHVLISLIQLPTITRLHLPSIADFPANQLSLCSGLRYLTLGRIPDFALHNVSFFPVGWTVPTLSSLEIRTTDSFKGLAILMDPDNGPNALGPIIDFSHLEDASLTIESEPAAVDQASKLLKTAQQLQSISFNVGDRLDAVRLTSLGPILAAHAPSALKSISMESQVGWLENETTLWGLDSVLQDLAGSNVIEWIDLFIVITTEEGTHQFMDFGDLLSLDTILTEPGAFPKLRTVGIELRWDLYDPGDDSEDEEDEYVDNGRVTREHFMRLCNCPGVAFSFSEKEDRD